ncbi:MAG: MarR family transcriptional regulator [Gemmatimonadetes bacterium]|nr:MarR family transcriptional regulator [Gemmatimonadota bacterium]
MESETSALQREIRQNRPFRSPGQEASLAILHTADVVRRRSAATIERYGVTLQQYNVLRILRGAGAPIPTLEIGERMIEQTPGITRLLDRIESKGLVTRRRCPDDRRQVLCSITPAGLELLGRIDEVVDESDQDLVGMLRPEEQKELIRLLAAVRAGNE